MANGAGQARSVPSGRRWLSRRTGLPPPVAEGRHLQPGELGPQFMHTTCEHICAVRPACVALYCGYIGCDPLTPSGRPGICLHAQPPLPTPLPCPGWPVAQDEKIATKRARQFFQSHAILKSEWHRRRPVAAARQGVWMPSVLAELEQPSAPLPPHKGLASSNATTLCETQRGTSPTSSPSCAAPSESLRNPERRHPAGTVGKGRGKEGGAPAVGR